MARIKIEAPDKFVFSTEIALRISDINYGGHLGHDSVLSLTHEARVRFFKSFGFSELDVFGPGIVLSDVAIVYKSEGFYGDSLIIDVAVCDYTNTGCDLVYMLSEKETKRELAVAKTGLVFMSYKGRQVVHVPKRFKELFQAVDYNIEIKLSQKSF